MASTYSARAFRDSHRLDRCDLRGHVVLCGGTAGDTGGKAQTWLLRVAHSGAVRTGGVGHAGGADVFRTLRTHQERNYQSTDDVVSHESRACIYWAHDGNFSS